MTLSIAEAMQQAQDAMNGGDFRAASQTCTQLVRQFPGYARAHGLLGEAYREQGQLADAQQSFAAALTRYQRAPGTYLGLGLIAEDEGSPEHALAFCQVAWELAPEQRQLREPLARVAMRRYGSDGDLQLSHAALAQLHANASRLRRAVDEYRRALAMLPDRVDLKLGMAECLWRMGQDSEAAQLAREVLEQFPESAAALVIATDVEQRSGNTARAAELLRQLRAVDPDGEIVAGMLASNPRANRAYLAVEPSAIPELTDEVVAAPVERPRIAPAPDFDYRPSRVELPAASLEELEPISVEEFGGAPGAVAAGQELADAFDFASLGVEGDLTPISIEELGGLPEGFQPVSPEEFGGLPSDLPALDNLQDLELDFEIEGLEPLAAAEAVTEREEQLPEAAVPQAEAEAGRAPFDAEAFGFEDFSAADEVLATTPAGLDISSDWQVTEPEGDLASLAAALEGDIAEALNRAGEPVAPEEDIDASRPPTTAPGGYTTMLQSLGDAGLSPFDPRAREAASDGESMPSMEMDDQLLEQSRPPAQPVDADHLTADWDSIDDEILRAMPEGYQPGYTEELRSLGDFGLAPFEIEEHDSDLQGIAPFNPFATEPSTSSPFLTSPPAMESAAAEPAMEAGVEFQEDDELLGGLEPFAFEEFDSVVGQPSSDEQRPPWEMGASAVPSDEDLEALLANDDEQQAELDTALLAAVAEEQAAVDEAVAEHPSPDVTPSIESQIAADWSHMAASESVHELIPFEPSIAVTRDLSEDATTVDVEQADSPAVTEQRAGATVDTEDSSQVSTSELTSSLRPGTELFNRARQVKQELVAGGVISGDRELAGPSATDEPHTGEDFVATRVLDMPVEDLFGDEDDIGVGFDSARDVAALRAALELTPDDDEMHWWLAEALREQGDMVEAYGEYRWLIRNAPARHDAVLEALTECVDRDISPELAHRLLGDIYRRRGDMGRASSHAAASLQQRRRTGRR